VDDSGPEDLQPVVIVKDLQLNRGLSEWEIGWDPSHLHVAKDCASQILQYLFEVSLGNNLSLLDVLCPDIFESVCTDTFHLVECRVVRAIDCVFAVDITNTQESIVVLHSH